MEKTFETLLQTVVVVGSANLDLVVYTSRTPEPGETLIGDRFEEHPGGKGLNQAIASARQASTFFVGAIRKDGAGRTLGDALERARVGITHLELVDGASGVAVINVVSGGENSITVIPGANDEVTAEAARMALDTMRPRAVVTQLEVPLDTVAAAAAWAQDHGARWIFNPSPLGRFTEAPADHPIRQLLSTANPLIVNADEGRGVLGPDTWGADRSIEEVAIELSALATSVVVTDGPRGAYVGDREELTFLPAESVQAIDTTGAGDAFAGTLAARLVHGHSLLDSARHAGAAAAAVVATARVDR